MDARLTIELDADGDGVGENSDLPLWLREMIDRALSATGLRPKKVVASEDALESLIDVDLDTLSDKSCPICYDPYERKTETTSSEEKSKKKRKLTDKQYADLVSEEELIASKLNLAPTLNTQFNDPSLFFPSDEGSVNYSRFPIRNLSTLEDVSPADYFPGLDEEGNTVRQRYKKHKSLQDEGHIPVKMPQCDHIFGKTCVVEWLKNSVSCPLCRKEVDASKDEDPKVRKAEFIRSHSTSHFNNIDDTVNYIANHATDVFNPWRRPYNNLITPLTDSYMHQNWATPHGENYSRVGVREPNLVLPRRFPFPESTSHPFPIHRSVRRNTTTEARPRPTATRSNLHIVTNNGDDDENETNTNNDTATVTEGNTERNTETNTNERIERNNNNITFPGFNGTSSFIITRIGSPQRADSPLRTGGPERSRRSGRVHPYERLEDQLG